MVSTSSLRTARSVSAFHQATARLRSDGRSVMFVILVGYLTSIAAARLIWQVDLWPYVGVPSAPSLFFDARNLTAAWECQRLGYDPLYESPCDPWGRPLMYLRPWLVLGVLGLNQSHTVILSTILIAVMFLMFSLLLGRVSMRTGFLLGMTVCSPAVMLAVNRANMDIALFSLLAGSALLWRRVPSIAPVGSPVAVFIAATAKIYPAFALPAFLITGSRVTARMALLCIAAFTVYVAVSFRDIMHLAEIAPQGQHFSYGARILLAHIYHHVGADGWPGPAVLKQLVAAIPLALLGAVVAVHVHRRFGPQSENTTIATAPFVAFLTGAFIYLGTFAVINSYDYRLVFLLLTIPQLLVWARLRRHPLSLLSSATLVAILVLLWVGSLSEWLDLWDELASWLVAGLLVAVLATTLPRLPSARKFISGVGRPASDRASLI